MAEVEDDITIVDNYCIACQGECTNNDPSDYAHMLADWESLSGAWVDRGVSASDVWSFIATILLAIAKNNDVSWDEVQEVLHLAWKKGEEQ